MMECIEDDQLSCTCKTLKWNNEVRKVSYVTCVGKNYQLNELTYASLEKVTLGEKNTILNSS